MGDCSAWAGGLWQLQQPGISWDGSDEVVAEVSAAVLGGAPLGSPLSPSPSNAPPQE